MIEELFMDIQTLKQFYFDHLKEEGYSPVLHGDNCVRFKVEGNNHIISIDSDDLHFFSLATMYGLYCTEKCDKATMYKIVSKANNRVKMAKSYIVEDDEDEALIIIITTIECLLNKWADYKVYLERWLQIIAGCTKIIFKEIEKAELGM